MATMDKTSVREEIERLKHQFEDLTSAGKVSPEVQVVMNSLLVVVELILSIFLEKKTQKTVMVHRELEFSPHELVYSEGGKFHDKKEKSLLLE